MLSHTMSQHIPKDMYDMHARVLLYDPTDAEFQSEENEERLAARSFDGNALLDYLSKNKEALPYAELTYLIADVGEKFNSSRHLYSGGNKMSCHTQSVGNKLNIIFVTDIYDKYNTVKTDICVTASIPFVYQIGTMYYGLTHNFLQYLGVFPVGSAEALLLATLTTSS